MCRRHCARQWAARCARQRHMKKGKKGFKGAASQGEVDTVIFEVAIFVKCMEVTRKMKDAA